MGIESDDVVSTSKRGKLVVVLVLIVITVVVIAATVVWLTLPPQEEGPRVYTFAEYVNSAPHIVPAGTVFIIEDVVAETKNVVTPELRWNTTGDFIVNPGDRMNFTFIEFESISSAQLYFMGDRLADFPVGQLVRFNITYQEFDYGDMTKVESEHDYCFVLIINYKLVIMTGGYSPIEANVTLGGGNVTIRFTNLVDVYPLPVNWNRTSVEFLGSNGLVDAPGNGLLYENSNFVGTLIGSSSLANFSINLPLRIGQELRIPYDGTYIAIRFMAPSAVGFVFIS